jgi:hyperosmotically inducible periplasmic protein
MKKSTRSFRAALAGAALAAAFAFATAAQAAQPDPWVTTKVKLSLLTSRDVDGVDVKVDTIDGHVTLYGTAADQAEKDRAERLAKQVEGVKEVRNLIQVVPPSQEKRVSASDAQLKQKVQDALARDPQLAKSHIQVQSVDGGVVLLSGKADTMSAHLRAVEVARDVDGVHGVASEIQSPNELADSEIWHETQGAASDVAAMPEQAGSMAKDLWITTAAKVRLIGADVQALGINVDTTNGVVTLFGTVGSEAAKQTAENEVRKVSGVKEIHDELQVVPEAKQAAVKRKDEDVRKEVSANLESRGALSDVDVAVENGVVRLTGTVPTQGDRLAALTLARTSNGVQSVIGDLRVARN